MFASWSGASRIRRHAEASLREMAEWLGVSRANSVPNLTRRLEARPETSPELCADEIEILDLANEPATGIGLDSTASTRAPRRSAQPKTKNKG
jgi:hypothetical protein